MEDKNTISPISSVDDISVLNEKYNIKTISEDGILKNLDGTLFTEYPADFDIKKQELIDEFNYRLYGMKRAREYPKLADQLDALWKGDDALEEMRAKVMAVKLKYPKPE